MPAITDVFVISEYCLSIIKDDDSLSHLQAMVTNVSIPNLERNFDTDARSALPGLVPLPLGWNNQELSFSLQSFNQEVIKELANKINGLLKLQLNGCGLRHTDQTVINVTMRLEGFIGQGFGFELQAQSSATSEYRIMLNRYNIKIDDGTNETELFYDPNNYMLAVDGVNLLSSQASAIGITPGTTTSLID